MEDAATASAPPSAPEALPSVGELLAAGTEVARDNAGAILGVWAVAGLPPQLLALALTSRPGFPGDQAALRAALDAGDWSVLGPLAAVGLVSLVFGLLGYAAILLLTAHAHQGRTLSVSDALLGGAGRLLSAAAASVLVAAAIFAGSLALVLPGLYVAARLSLTVCAAVVEHAGPLDAAGRSWALTRGRVWDVSVRVLACVGAALVGMIALVIGGMALGALGALAGAAGAALARLAVNAAQFLLTAWVTACMTRLFLDLAARAARRADA
jgi:hypothetical protein